MRSGMKNYWFYVGFSNTNPINFHRSCGLKNTTRYQCVGLRNDNLGIGNLTVTSNIVWWVYFRHLSLPWNQITLPLRRTDVSLKFTKWKGIFFFWFFTHLSIYFFQESNLLEVWQSKKQLLLYKRFPKLPLESQDNPWRRKNMNWWNKMR